MNEPDTPKDKTINAIFFSLLAFILVIGLLGQLFYTHPDLYGGDGVSEPINDTFRLILETIFIICAYLAGRVR